MVENSRQRAGNETSWTILTVRVVSCDAKVIGSLVGGCRVTVRHAVTGDRLARGLHLGGSGETDRIMHQPPGRGGIVYGTEGAASCRFELCLDEPTPVEVIAEGPLAFAQALQRASVTTWLVPGEHVEGEGLVLQLQGFLVEVTKPAAVDLFHSGDTFGLEASVRLL